MKNKGFLWLCCGLMACGSLGNTDHEKEYGARFEKEYAAFVQSEELKKFEANYAKICDVSSRVDGGDSLMLVDSLNLPDSLSFISYRTDVENMEILMKTNEKKTPMFFSDYANHSSDVNAVMVSVAFHQKDYAKSNVTYEFMIHQAAAIKDLGAFKKTNGSIDPVNENLYRALCNTRIKTDQVAHARYAVLVQTIGQDKAEQGYTIGNTTSFTPGGMYGLVYVYDLQAGVFKKIIPVMTTNSETVNIAPGENTDRQLSEDLKRNFSDEVAACIRKYFGVKDEIPAFMAP